MLTVNTLLIPRESIVKTDLDDGSAVLLRLDGTEFYTLNPAAIFIWNLIERGKKINEIVDSFSEEYEGDREAIKKSTLRQIKEFVAEGLVEVSSTKLLKNKK